MLCIGVAALHIVAIWAGGAVHPARAVTHSPSCHYRMYHDPKPPARWPAILLTLLVVTLFTNLWLPELTSKEAVNALMARDLLEGNLVRITLMGKETLHPPMASWLIALFSLVLPLGEVTIRLVDLLALLGLAAACAIAVRRVAGTQAAAVTAAAVGSSFAALDAGTTGEGSMLFCLFINLAWLIWYRLSREHRRWLYAWFLSLLMACLAILAGGFQALFYFYFPLLLLRRPLNSLRRLRQSDHLLSLTFFLVVILAWILLVPNLSDQLFLFVSNFEASETSAGYVKRFVLFPLRVTLAYLPWAFLVWPAFCLAFRPLEKDPVMAQYLRTIVVSLFALFWLLPDAKPTALLPLIGPLSILIGLNYEILVRRHGEKLLQVGRFFAYLSIVISAFAIMLGLYLLNQTPGTLTPGITYLNLVFLCAAIIGAFLVIRHRRQMPVWMVTVAAIAAFHVTYASTYKVRDYLVNSERRQLGRELQTYIPPGEIVYELSPGSFPAACYYLDRPVIQISSPREVPGGPELVYVLGDNQVPITGDRDWSPLTPPISHEDYTLRVWSGKLR